MSYQTFLKALRKTPRKWQISDGGLILQGVACPLTIHFGWPEWRFGDAASILGIRKLAKALVNAADNRPRHSKRIRRDLLKACGLKERAGQ